VDKDGSFYVVDVYGECEDIRRQIDVLFMMWERWGVVRGYMEMTGGFRVLEAILQNEMSERRKWLYMEQFPRTMGGKEHRNVVALQGHYRSGRIFHHWRLRGGEMETELLEFPRGKFDDLVDALVMAITQAQSGGYFGKFPGEQEAKIQAAAGFGRWPHIGFTLEEIAAGMPEEYYERALRDAVVGIYRIGESYDG